MQSRAKRRRHVAVLLVLVWSIFHPESARGHFVCKFQSILSSWKKPLAPPAVPETKVHDYLSKLLAKHDPKTRLKIVDLGGANYTGDAGTGDTILASLVAQGYQVTYYVNDLESGPTRKAAAQLKKRWGDRVEVVELPGDYGGSRMADRLAEIRPDLTFMMNPGKEAIEGLGGTVKMAGLMKAMADRSRHGLYFRTAFHESSTGLAEDFKGLFPQRFFESHFPERAVLLGTGDPYRADTISGPIGTTRDYHIPPEPRAPSRR